jgi:phosphoribosylglycinamide formyltransferase-1
LNLCIFASGNGSNLKYLFKAQNSGKINSKIRLVISNNSGSGAFAFAVRNKIPSCHIIQKQFNNELDFTNHILKKLSEHRIDLIILGGYMKLLPYGIIKKYKNRIFNVHPALIPAFCGKGFYGLKVHEEVLKYGCKISGATVHLVDEEYDHGSIVLQQCVSINDYETPVSLRKKILKIENKLLLKTVQLFESKKFNIIERKVFFS